MYLIYRQDRHTGSYNILAIRLIEKNRTLEFLMNMNWVKVKKNTKRPHQMASQRPLSNGNGRHQARP